HNVDKMPRFGAVMTCNAAMRSVGGDARRRVLGYRVFVSATTPVGGPVSGSEWVD
ncbi:MAG: hypothetical protein ACI9JD_004280, partial [Rhodococcus sp. (in: high G+C Gram-positive bacteria)]